MPKANPTPQLSRLIQAEPDLVDRIFEFLIKEHPEIAGLKLDETRKAVREEFAGEEVYIASRPPTERERITRGVLQLFNGRNATEVARSLQISRATVYRCLKQSGVLQKKDSLTFPGNETETPIG